MGRHGDSQPAGLLEQAATPPNQEKKVSIQYSGYALNKVPDAMEVTGNLRAPTRGSILAISGYKFRQARQVAREKIQRLHPGAGFIHEHRITQYLSIFTVGGAHGVDHSYVLAPHEHARRTD